MAKRVITITVDEDVYIHYKVLEKINVSGAINDFLKGMMNIQTEDEEEIKILMEIEEIQKQREEINHKHIKLTSKLSRIKKKQEEQEIEELERLDFITKTTRNSGAMQDKMRNL